MSYQPRFTITPALLALVEDIAALRERIEGASVGLSWIPALQKDTRTRNAHASTAIEGNPLTLPQVRAIEEGTELDAADQRSQREVANYFAGLRYIEKHSGIKTVRHTQIFRLHRILADGVMDQGKAGQYRTIEVRVGDHAPPAPEDVQPLTSELLDWWNNHAVTLSPVLSSAILHYRFEDIHPFADGNGRAGRALSLWELYRRGFDSHHIFSVDEYYWENRPAYYSALAAVERAGNDLTGWLEYSAKGLKRTLEQAWLRVQSIQTKDQRKITLTVKQERLLALLRDHGAMSPREIWDSLGLSKQGAMNVINPLLKAGLIEKHGSKKSGRYVLANT
jgi:Fic family protein